MSATLPEPSRWQGISNRSSSSCTAARNKPTDSFVMTVSLGGLTGGWPWTRSPQCHWYGFCVRGWIPETTYCWPSPSTSIKCCFSATRNHKRIRAKGSSQRYMSNRFGAWPIRIGASPSILMARRSIKSEICSSVQSISTPGKWPAFSPMLALSASILAASASEHVSDCQP